VTSRWSLLVYDAVSACVFQGFGDAKTSRFGKAPEGACWAPYGVRAPNKGARHMLTHEARVGEIKKWMEADRFKRTYRNYTAEDVARLRGSVEWPRPPSSLTASKLFELVRNLREQGRCTTTFGCLDVAQLTQMSRFAETIYVSGWQASSHHSSIMEPGPDLADYPLDTVPKHVERLFRAQQFHDRKQFEEQWTKKDFENNVDYLRPIVADGDTGHGGMTAVMRLTKSMIDAGAAGIHFEDQRHGAKKCGHMGGKVLVSTREHIDRLMAARLQADICGAETVIVARTDAEAAKLIESNQDPRDHVFIMGTTNPNAKPYRNAESPEEVAKWKEENTLVTYYQAVLAELKAANAGEDKLAKWSEANAKFPGIANEDARTLARELLGKDIFWSWELPRTREGYFVLQPGIETCIHRMRHFAPYADIMVRTRPAPCCSPIPSQPHALTYHMSSRCAVALYLSPRESNMFYTCAVGRDCEAHPRGRQAPCRWRGGRVWPGREALPGLQPVAVLQLGCLGHDGRADAHLLQGPRQARLHLAVRDPGGLPLVVAQCQPPLPHPRRPAVDARIR